MLLKLSQILDQKHAIDTLNRAIKSDKLHHAYLFEGPPGVGKELTALSLAASINCKVSNEPCLSCINCKKIASKNHPDVKILSPAPDKKNILIDTIREAEDWVRMRPHEGKSKILIISPAETMNEAAANALLKTLEEPREGNYLILVTSMPRALLPTIRSRCQSIRFKALDDETVVEMLLNHGVSESEAHILAVMGAGSIERALAFLDADIERKIQLVLNLLIGTASKLPQKALEAAESLRDRQDAMEVLELYLFFMEELMYLRSDRNMESTNPLMKKLGDTLSILQNRGTIFDVCSHIASINKAYISIKRNNMNPQLALEGMIMNMRIRDGNRDEAWSRIGGK